jgi:glutamate-1-semialdehyde 2,1-aminomutase
MMERGVWLPPSQFEAAFLSAAHTEQEIAQTIEAAVGVMREIGAAK